MKDGMPVDVSLNIEVNFNLRCASTWEMTSLPNCMSQSVPKVWLKKVLKVSLICSVGIPTRANGSLLKPKAQILYLRRNGDGSRLVARLFLPSIFACTAC